MSDLPDNPIFVVCDPGGWADEVKERLLGLGCSKEYAEADRLNRIAHTVQIVSVEDGNAILCGRLAT